jgi:hypothetical protein
MTLDATLGDESGFAALDVAEGKIGRQRRRGPRSPLRREAPHEQALFRRVAYPAGTAGRKGV